MENPTSFNLNQATQQWRENLGQSPVFRQENLNELESHLRDSMATLQTGGLSAEEAFLLATRRMGGGAPLEAEFCKVNGQAIWLDRLLWMLIGYQVWGFVSGAIGLITRNALLFGLHGAGYDFKAHSYAVPVAFITLVQLAGFVGSLGLCCWLFRQKGQRFGLWLGKLLQRRTTWALTFAGLYLLSLSITLIGWGTQSLVVTSVGREKMGAFYFSQGVSSAISLLISTAVLVGLTLFLARKRLRMVNT